MNESNGGSLLIDNSDHAQNLKPLYQEVTSLITEHTLFVIDQVSMLSCLGLSVSTVGAFCHQLMTFVASKNDSRIVLRSVEGQLANFLQTMASLTLSVRGLQTGQSRDVSGVITIKEKRRRTFHYRLDDKTVKIFPPGTSSAVL